VRGRIDEAVIYTDSAKGGVVHPPKREWVCHGFLVILALKEKIKGRWWSLVRPRPIAKTIIVFILVFILMFILVIILA